MTSHPFRSEIFALGDEYVEWMAQNSPIEATSLGVPVNQDRFDDFSLASADKFAQYQRECLLRLNAISPIDDIDRIAQSVMRERLETRIALHESREAYIAFGAIVSPAMEMRQAFE